MESSCEAVSGYPSRLVAQLDAFQLPAYQRSPPDSALVGLNMPNIVMVICCLWLAVAVDVRDNILTCSGPRQGSAHRPFVGQQGCAPTSTSLPPHDNNSQFLQIEQQNVFLFCHCWHSG